MKTPTNQASFNAKAPLSEEVGAGGTASTHSLTWAEVNALMAEYKTPKPKTAPQAPNHGLSY